MAKPTAFHNKRNAVTREVWPTAHPHVPALPNITALVEWWRFGSTRAALVRVNRPLHAAAAFGAPMLGTTSSCS
jgi:hypothetical protein